MCTRNIDTFAKEQNNDWVHCTCLFGNMEIYLFHNEELTGEAILCITLCHTANVSI